MTVPTRTKEKPKGTTREDVAYEVWRKEMIYLIYGPQNKKTWDVNNRADCVRVGNEVR